MKTYEMSLICRLRQIWLIKTLPTCRLSPISCALMHQQHRNCGAFKIDCGRTKIDINVVKGIDYDAVPLSKYDEHNKKLGRPLAPHMSIYKPQLTWMLSLAHRITGIVMASYMYTFAGGIWLFDDLNALLNLLSDQCDTVGEDAWYAAKYTLRFLIAFPFVYHCANAFRHLAWDSGLFLRIKQVYFTGWMLQALVIAVTVALVYET